MVKYAVFDLDGTLLFTLESILYHLNNTLTNNGLKRITLDECCDFIGNGARLLVSRAVSVSGVTDTEIVNKVLIEYNDAYNTDPLPYTYAYEGIDGLVDALIERGVTVGVVTNKPEPTAVQLIRHFFGNKVSFVRGGRAGAILKPDPRDTLDALAAIGGAAAECAFIGDTSVDIATGKNMGAAVSIGVLWGFRTKEELLGAGADAVVTHPSEILGIIEKYEKN
jgi:phosphoglycolate phosphatase